jgi:hypothetical protein
MAIQKFTTTTTGTVNQPPVAVLATQKIDALMGHIVQLDGRQSYDPEKQPLTWKWRFAQVPIGSEVATTGFREIRPRSTAVSFIPDKIGIYVVELVVNDGELDSSPVTATVNIQFSRVPCGENIIPDAHFLWDYISNFWNLVEDREIITSVWSSAMQIIGSDLIQLWGADLNKAIGTIQSTFQRRWQGLEATTDLYAELDQRIIVGKTDSGTGGAVGNLGETPGTGNTKVFYLPLGEVGGITETNFSNLEGNYGAQGRIIVVNGEGYTIRRVSQERLTLSSGEDLVASGQTVSSATATFLSDGLQLGDSFHILTGVDASEEYVVSALTSETDLDLELLDGSIPTLSSSGSRFDAGRWYSLVVVDEEAIPEGQVNIPWRVPHLLHIPSVNFEDEGVRTGDVLVFEVKRRDTGQSAELRTQVVGVDRTRLGFEFTLEDLENGVDNIERELFQQLVQDLNIISPDATDADTAAVGEALLSFMPVGINLNSRPFSTYRVTLRAKKIIHNTMIVVDDDLVSVPALQETPKDPPVVLRENLDYVVDDGAVVFISSLFSPKSPSPEIWWAECVVYDNSDVIEGNFGKLVSLLRDDLTAKKTRAPYLSAVRGLIFAYTNGPTVRNIRLGMQILMGLPFAEERGVILSIEDSFSTAPDGSSLGRYLTEDVDDNDRRLGVRRVYYYSTAVGREVNPASGELYEENDVVELFAPLSKGVEVQDYIKNPTWWIATLGGLEILKFFRFKAVVDSDIFDSNDIVFAIDFVRNIRPYYTEVISTALMELVDEISVTDVLSGSFTAAFYDNNWGLEATNRPSDDNQQGVTLWNADSRPLSTRLPTLLRDVVTSKSGADVAVYSETGWNVDAIRAREFHSAVREADLFFILRGQPGATFANPGIYEIKDVIDGNNLTLQSYAPSADPLTYDFTALDADLFNYGSGLVCTIMRRELNPVTMGLDLDFTDSNLATSMTAKFLTNGVQIGDHLVSSDSLDPTLGEYIIDALTPLPTLPSPPVISETQVRLKNLDGSTPTLTTWGNEFYVIRPVMQKRVISPGRWISGSSALHVADVADGNREFFVFTPGMIGMRINVSNSQNPANDGNFVITGYIGPGTVTTDNPSGVGDTGYQSIITLGERPANFERARDFGPYGLCEVGLIGDDGAPPSNLLDVVDASHFQVYPSAALTTPWALGQPAGPVAMALTGDQDDARTTYDGNNRFIDADATFVSDGVQVGYILEIKEGVDAGFHQITTVVGEDEVYCNLSPNFDTAVDLEYAIGDVVNLGFKAGDKVYLDGVGFPNHDRVFTIVDPSTFEVLEVITTPDTNSYKFKIYRRMSV